MANPNFFSELKRRYVYRFQPIPVPVRKDSNESM